MALSAFCLGTMNATEIADFLGKSRDDVAFLFNEWLKIMPPFVLAKWDGVHYEAMELNGMSIEPDEIFSCDK